MNTSTSQPFVSKRQVHSKFKDALGQCLLLFLAAAIVGYGVTKICLKPGNYLEANIDEIHI